MPVTSAATIFTADEAGVTPPVPIDQRLPQWAAPSSQRNESFSGLIEVVIDETGKVTSAAVTESVNVQYDRLLLQAARLWEYRPAQREGRPVKFRRVVSVVLAAKPE
ncbi:MAG: TonB family protein [Luteitalea sp.]|nr:TonB family protein [Luteitalea sp.]